MKKKKQYSSNIRNFLQFGSQETESTDEIHLGDLLSDIANVNNFRGIRHRPLASSINPGGNTISDPINRGFSMKIRHQWHKRSAKRKLHTNGKNCNQDTPEEEIPGEIAADSISPPREPRPQKIVIWGQVLDLQPRIQRRPTLIRLNGCLYPSTSITVS